MHSALNQLIRDAFADSANDVFLIEDEPPRIRREGEVVTLHPGPIPRVAMEEFWKSCGVGSTGGVRRVGAPPPGRCSGVGKKKGCRTGVGRRE